MIILLAATALGAMSLPAEPLPRDLTHYLPMSDIVLPMTVTVAVTVDAAGSPLRCDIVGPSANMRFNRMSCEMMMHRARFRPATDEAGVPVAAIVEQGIGINTGVPRPHAVDFALPVSHMAGPATAVADARVITGTDGHVTSCAVAVGTGTVALDRLVCPGIADVVLPVARTGAGAPLRAMRIVTVGFATGAIGHRID